VTGMSSLLRQTLEDSVGARELEMLEMIERNGLQMSRLVSDLLLMSRAEIDALEPATEDIHLTDFLKSVLDGLARDVELLAPTEDVVVTADPGHVQRILDNLVVNAKRYGAPPYRLSVIPHEGAVEVRLADAGPGVPDELMGRLFTKFARGPGSTRAESTGLGLAISRSLARANGGDAWYEPNRPTGAVFCIRLRRTGSMA
jgi:signal transduction histidine kinase